MSSVLPTLSRRQFLASGVAAGLGLVVPLRMDGAAHAAGETGAAAAGTPGAALAQVTPWIRIAPDGTVVAYLSQSEVGQGITTGLMQMLADELDADWSKLTVARAPVRAPYQVHMRGMNFQGTFGSTSTALIGPAMRNAGAAAREMLMQAAAASWGVTVGELATEKGWVTHRASGRRADYGSLATAAAALPVPEKPRLKSRAEYRLVGQPMKRLDTPAKTNGSAIFGIDVRVPNMLYGAVVHAPILGAPLAGSNAETVKEMPGIVAVVPMQGAMVVVAESFWQAKKGADALKLNINAPQEAAQFSSAAYGSSMRAALDGETLPSGSRGRGGAAFEGVAKVLQADYEFPYMAHAPLEPPCATADVRADGATLWLPIQQQTFATLGLSKVLGMRPDQITIHTTLIGGSFGRKNPPDFAIQAALASKACGRPVKLVWSREQDIRHDKYRPAFMGRMRAGLDQNGELVALSARVAAQSLLAQVNPAWVKNGVDESTTEGTDTNTYNIPNLQVESINMKAPVPLYFWRSVGNSPNVFMLESFLDEIARSGRKDPYQMRRSLLRDDPRGLAVLDAAAKSAGWGTRKMGKGQGMGICYFPHRGRGDSYVTRVAVVAALSVDRNGMVRLGKMHIAVDAGTVINPKLIEAQMQSGIGWGLTQAFKGKITFENGQVQQSNFHDYPLLTLSEMPEIKVTLIDNEHAPGGVGEVAVPPVGPAVANAIFAASGKRLRRMPFVDDGILLGPAIRQQV